MKNHLLTKCQASDILKEEKTFKRLLVTLAIFVLILGPIACTCLLDAALDAYD
jgi:hypothetical protein